MISCYLFDDQQMLQTICQQDCCFVIQVIVVTDVGTNVVTIQPVASVVIVTNKADGT